MRGEPADDHRRFPIHARSADNRVGARQAGHGFDVQLLGADAARFRRVAKPDAEAPVNFYGSFAVARLRQGTQKRSLVRMQPELLRRRSVLRNIHQENLSLVE